MRLRLGLVAALALALSGCACHSTWFRSCRPVTAPPGCDLKKAKAECDRRGGNIRKGTGVCDVGLNTFDLCELQGKPDGR